VSNARSRGHRIGAASDFGDDRIGLRLDELLHLEEVGGLMGVGWLWLLDPDKRTVETFASVRSKMIAGPAFGASSHVSAPPFESLRLPLDSLFPGG
jgi:hypothetical protein